jgi:putative SOS response-associated peptidase YedK
MCGRFVLTASPEAIQQAFNLETMPQMMIPRFNIAPSQPVAVITNENPRELTFHRWGLIPSWSKDLKIGNSLINARAEGIEDKPSFRSAFKRRRCLIPADGFFEWSKSGGKDKTPMFVHLKNKDLFAFAGLWEIWRTPEGDEIRSCTIVTTEPNELVSQFHHRMAVILHPEDYGTWLTPGEVPAPVLKDLLRPYEADKMAYYEVSKMVNSPNNDTPDCIEPLVHPSQPSLLQ